MNAQVESQRDSGAKPKVARNELPWIIDRHGANPKGVAANYSRNAATPLGLDSSLRITQGGSFLATLGWMTQSRWDWPNAKFVVRACIVVVSFFLFGSYAHSQPIDTNSATVRFIAVDIFVNSSSQPLAAYQMEFAATNGVAKIVGIEGGEHAAFREAPHYDPKAMQSDRVIIAAYSTASSLPTGKTRVATIHLQVTGNSPPQFGIRLETAGNSTGTKIEATPIFEERKNK